MASRNRLFVFGMVAFAAIAVIMTIVATVGPPGIFQGLKGTGAATASKNDLWFAGLDESGDLDIASATAIIDGKRWDGWPDAARNSPTIPPNIDAIPPEWLPSRRKFPTVWQAHLFNGNTFAIKATGMKRDAYGGLNVITTNLTPASLSPTFRDFASEEGVSGFAVVGDIEATLFRSMTRDEQKRALLAIEPRLWEAESKAIMELAASQDDEVRQEAAQFTDALRRSQGLTVAHAVAVTQRDNVRLFYMELEKQYRGLEKPLVYMTRFGATLSESASGNLQVLSVGADIVGDKDNASRVPLAVVERNGVQCWLTNERLYENTVFPLTSPGQWVLERDNCGLK